MTFMPFINLKSNSKLILSVIFIVSILVRYLLSRGNHFIHTYYDELIYINLARSLLGGETLVRSVPVFFMQVLYPLIISPLSFIKDPLISYEAIKLINCIIMSSVIFPSYLLAKKVIGDERQAILVGLLSVLMPEMFLTVLVLSECLFYPLVIWMLYFIWEYLSCEKSKIPYLLLILIVGILLYFTKIVSLYFVPAIIVLILLEPVLKSKKHITLIAFSLVIAIFSFVLIKYGTHYLSSINLAHISLDKVKYIFYCVGIYTVYITFALLLFPIITPIIEFKNLSSKLKKFIVINFTILLFACFVVSATVLLLEEYPKALMRIHLRYMFPMLIPFLIIFLKIHSSGIVNKKAVIYTGVSFAVLSVLFIAIPPSGDSIADSALISHISQSQANSILNFDNGRIALKISNFDIFKNVIIAFFLLGSFYIRSSYFPKFFVISLTVIFIINNFISYDVDFKKVSGQDDIVSQAITVSSHLSGRDILLISQSVISDKIMETYLNKPYYLVLEQNFKESFHGDFSELPAVSIQRGKIYEETVYIEGINRVSANINYVILGKDTQIPNFGSLKYRDITPDKVTEFRLLEVLK